MATTETETTRYYDPRDNGLYLIDEHGSRKICSHIKKVALTRDENDDNWGRLVRITDPGGNSKELAIPMTSIGASSSGCINMLVHKGLTLTRHNAKTKDELAEYITQPDCDDMVRCVTKPGWYKSVFVMPHKVIGNLGKANDKVVLQTTNTRRMYAGIRGTLEDWQLGIGQYLAGNSREPPRVYWRPIYLRG